MNENNWAIVTYEENITINDIVKYFNKNRIKAIKRTK